MAQALPALVLGMLAPALPWGPASFAHLPLLALLLLSGAVPMLVRRPAAGRMLGAFAFGMLWAALATTAALDERLEACADDRYRQLDLEIVSAPTLERPADPQAADAGTAEEGAGGHVISRFDARVLAAIERGDCAVAPGRTLRLSWYQAPALALGQRWRVTVRVRPPWSYRNPAGFDYERWLLAEGYAGTGYVKSGRLRRAGPNVESSLGQWLARHGGEHAGIFLALARGDRSAISADLWEQLRRSGTVHLMVVSGLHVGLLCTVVVYGAFALLRLGLFGRRAAPLPIVSALAVLVAGLFVLTSGAGVPAQRAWLMAGVLLAALACGWRGNAAQALLLGLALVLLLDPLAAHGRGTWLSFGAVAALLLALSGAAEKSWPAALLRVQLVLFVLLTPLLAAQQGEAPGLGTLVNVLAVPLLALLLPPLLLAVALHELAPELAGGLLWLSARLLDLKLLLIASAARAPLLPAGGLAERWLPLTLVAGHLLLTTPGWRWRLALLLPWSLWLAPGSVGVPAGAFRLTVFDVGQGSALLVETRRHRLLYDAGPAYPGGLDLGAAVLVPSLRRAGAGALDALVLSHGDTDHTGGAASVLEAIGAGRVYGSASVAPPPGYRLTRCERGDRWHWDGVEFQFLHPEAGAAAASSNDGSCVLRVAAASGAAVLAGDISAKVERRLVRGQREALLAELVTAPHHGSNSSSSRPYLTAAAPRWVLISAPRRSRYGHPHPDVLARIKARGAEYAVTGWRGALRWDSWRPGRLAGDRDQRPYWVNPPATAARARRGG